MSIPKSPKSIVITILVVGASMALINRVAFLKQYVG